MFDKLEKEFSKTVERHVTKNECGYIEAVVEVLGEVLPLELLGEVLGFLEDIKGLEICKARKVVVKSRNGRSKSDNMQIGEMSLN